RGRARLFSLDVQSIRLRFKMKLPVNLFGQSNIPSGAPTITTETSWTNTKSHLIIDTFTRVSTAPFKALTTILTYLTSRHSLGSILAAPLSESLTVYAPSLPITITFSFSLNRLGPSVTRTRSNSHT